MVTTARVTPVVAQINPDLDVYCLGGREPPRNCPSNDYKASPRDDACVCKDGFYQGATGCVACDAGHTCINGTKLPCPKHSYQPARGATACLDCVASRDENGIYSECGRNQQLMFCDVGKATRLSENCVPCTRCRRAYLTRGEAAISDGSEVDCYRSNGR